MQLYYGDVFKIIVAMVIGLIIGVEREYRSKPAGLRTLMLVSVGSCIFTMLSVKIGINNPDRLAANIITGIGFLGAGAIFKDDNRVSGLTTATTIWVCAALGMSVGSGYIFLAFAGAAAVLCVLSLLVFAEHYIDTRSGTRGYRIVCVFTHNTLEYYEKIFNDVHLEVSRGTQTVEAQNITGHWKLTGSKASHDKLITILLNDPAIKELDF
ncbi:MAG: MgtC/SapB family protein [Ferruginibacter sp.]|jgi:putative Mg2+ transporter-C (MgtC) family protein|uniref:MgtC/SapB family protein n=2 Tax=Ferruginibacter sp. TaxID=1940288 RepID=UPI0019ABE540|nr:MgtC/SapB family protein [Ferruginibacter sp.]